jgi:hypothetical protein
MSYISELEHELLRVGRARQRRRLASVPRVPHVSFGGAAVTVAGVSSLVLAVLAIALLGHRAPVHQDNPTVPSSRPARLGPHAVLYCHI